MTALETDRLILRRLTLDDAEFILRLVNDPSWLRYIGDRGVRTLEDARAYLRKGPIAMYEIFGFGLYAAQRRLDGAVLGLCGLIKRNFLRISTSASRFFRNIADRAMPAKQPPPY